VRLIVNIDVPALEPAIAFYTAAFDLRLTRLLDDDVVELRGGSCVIYLLMKPAGSAIAPTLAGGRGYERHWTPVHIDFVVDDVEQAALRAIAAGAVRESECVEWRGSKCITFSDPFGHGFCLIEFAGDTYAD
jgi:predicted enzyme related to lactoylglutathione lyase